MHRNKVVKQLTRVLFVGFAFWGAWWVAESIWPALEDYVPHLIVGLSFFWVLTFTYAVVRWNGPILTLWRSDRDQ